MKSIEETEKERRVAIMVNESARQRFKSTVSLLGESMVDVMDKISKADIETLKTLLASIK